MRAAIALLVAVLSLGGIHQAEAQSASQAIRTLQTSQNERDRWRAAFTLGRSGDPRAIAACARALRTDPSAKVRTSAVIALRRLVTASTPASERARAISALSRAANRDPSPAVQRTAKRMHKLLSRGTSTQAMQGSASASGPRP
jgi:HEAT repeat protein